MVRKNHMPRLLLAVVCASFIALTSLAADPSAPSTLKLLGEDEVTLQKIKTFFEAALYNAEFDKDGDLRITDGGLKTYVAIDKEKKVISFFSLWPLKASAPEIKRLQLLNSMNRDLILVRFYMQKPTVMVADYQFLYEKGITPYTIMSHYRLYAKVVKGGVIIKDPENIIG